MSIEKNIHNLFLWNVLHIRLQLCGLELSYQNRGKEHRAKLLTRLRNDIRGLRARYRKHRKIIQRYRPQINQVVREYQQFRHYTARRLKTEEIKINS